MCLSTPKPFDGYVNVVYLTAETDGQIIYAACTLPARHMCGTELVRSRPATWGQSETNNRGGKNSAPSCMNLNVLNKEI